MGANFDRCLARVLIYEGGNDDDPRDPGGRTSRGIIQSEYEHWLKSVGKWAVVADHDVWHASDADIRAIYKANYWDRMHCEEQPEGIDIATFDSGVNSGVSQIAKWCQRATGVVVDGDFGPETLHALQSVNDNDALIADILSRRMAMLKSLKTWKVYGKGWSARVANVLKIAQAWATGSVGPSPVAVHEDNGNRKAFVSDVKQPVISVNASQVATGSSALSAGVANFVSQAQPVADKLDSVPWLQWVSYGLAGLTLVGIAAGVVASIAQAQADRAKNAEGKAEIDVDADSTSTPVSVNDNVPAGEKAGAA
jgi:lysozyme family protein